MIWHSGLSSSAPMLQGPLWRGCLQWCRKIDQRDFPKGHVLLKRFQLSNWYAHGVPKSTKCFWICVWHLINGLATHWTLHREHSIMTAKSNVKSRKTTCGFSNVSLGTCSCTTSLPFTDVLCNHYPSILTLVNPHAVHMNVLRCFKVVGMCFQNAVNHISGSIGACVNVIGS